MNPRISKHLLEQKDFERTSGLPLEYFHEQDRAKRRKQRAIIVALFFLILALIGAWLTNIPGRPDI